MPALQYERPGDPRRDDGARYTLQLLRIRRIFCYDRGSLLTVISRGAERIGGLCRLPHHIHLKADLRTDYF